MNHKQVLIAICTIFLSSSVFAHLDAGSDEVIGKYFLDFGYSPANPTSDDLVFLNINLLINETQTPTNATHVWTRISDSKGIVYAGSMQFNEGTAGMQFTFPHSGKYKILTRYFQDEELLVEKTYEMKISSKQNWLVYLIPLGIAICILIISFRSKIKTKRKHHSQRL